MKSELILCKYCEYWEPEEDKIVGECKHPDNPGLAFTVARWGKLCELDRALKEKENA